MKNYFLTIILFLLTLNIFPEDAGNSTKNELEMVPYPKVLVSKHIQQYLDKRTTFQDDSSFLEQNNGLKIIAKILEFLHRSNYIDQKTPIGNQCFSDKSSDSYYAGKIIRNNYEIDAYSVLSNLLMEEVVSPQKYKFLEDEVKKLALSSKKLQILNLTNSLKKISLSERGGNTYIQSFSSEGEDWLLHNIDKLKSLSQSGFEIEMGLNGRLIDFKINKKFLFRLNQNTPAKGGGLMSWTPSKGVG